MSMHNPHNLIVNYLPHNFYEEDLEKLFSSVAKPTYVKIMKNNMGVSKGFGFVNFATRKEAELCQAKFNKYQITDRKQLKVSWSRPGDRVGCNLHVKHIPREWNEEDLKNLFLPFGEIIDVRVLRFPNSVFNKESGFVRFDNPGEAREAARRLNGYRPSDHPECCIQIEIAHKDMKKIENRYNRKFWRDNHLKHSGNSIVAVLMGLYGERKELEMAIAQASSSIHYGKDKNHLVHLHQLQYSRKRVLTEMKTQLRLLYHTDPSSAEIVARVDDQCAIWLNELLRGTSVPYRHNNSVLGASYGNEYAIGSQYASNPYVAQQQTYATLPAQQSQYTSSIGGKRSWHDNYQKNHDAYSQSSTSHSSPRAREEHPCARKTFTDCIFFSNFPPEFPEEVIKSTFERYSRLAQLKVEYDNNGALLGMGFARFKTPSETRKVHESLNGTEFLGRKVALKMSQEGDIPWN